ncbi:hypothetical protein FOA52_015768 [Chlamydomonas sp. UWO 241]|nr:hypothetical protein FOA52_015768 [Chlamydomonas sp. UWO 241]
MDCFAGDRKKEADNDSHAATPQVQVMSMGSEDEKLEVKETAKERARRVIIGDYDYKVCVRVVRVFVFVCMHDHAQLQLQTMCMPAWNPWSKKIHHDANMKFFGPNEPMPVFLMLVMGLQHALAMVGGIITPPVLVGLATRDADTKQALVSAALIVSSLCTVLQVVRIPIYGTQYYVGSGLLSVIGTSFTFLPISRGAIATQMASGKSFDEAYGALLGVYIVGALAELSMSFIPRKYIKKIFPPWISGLTIFLIGAALIKSGMQSWGGGSFCATTGKLCTDVGDSHLPYASPAYIGLGFFVLTVTVFLELFGSPFLRSAQVAIGLLIGYALAAGTSDINGDKYVNTSKIDSAPVITFLWVKTFPIGFYAPAILPVLIGFLVSGVESIGDLTATGEASGLHPESSRQAEAIFAAFAMSLPNTTFSQNNGVIALTRVSSRLAGLGCALWLFLFGIFGQVGAFFTSIPGPVLGGMTTFLFANITVSGIKVIGTKIITRRIRFILSVSLVFGLGITLWPQWAEVLNCTNVGNSGVTGLCEAAKLTLTTGYAIGCITALILHGVMPQDWAEEHLAPDRTCHYTTQPVDVDMAELKAHQLMLSGGGPIVAAEMTATSGPR